jgi:4-diphosphocytidyl-2-C-methyl-D-erythritol kinase
MLTGVAPAKLNLALVVGALRPGGKHEVVSVVDQLALADTLTVTRAAELRVDGYAEDTLVARALTMLAELAGTEPGYAVSIEKRIPVAAGLGGGSSDAAAALRLANDLLPAPLPPAELHELAGELGADVPLFLRSGPALLTGDGTTVEALVLPRDYHVVVWLPDGEAKESTASVYERFDERRGEEGFEERRLGLLDALAAVRTATDLAALPPNDLVASPHTETLLGLGAFRADVTGAGPALYGLFDDIAKAAEAAVAVESRGRAWITAPFGHG